ncbi:MAG: hypothetical protein KDC34_20455 [Saprospiraceae bacterium]|nr:hypothetical protein [Saprospiraceae bacterium]
MRNYYTSILFWILTVPCAFAQSVEFPAPFDEKLAIAGLEISQPLDAAYQTEPVYDNPYQQYDFAIHSKLEGMEIRYFVLPYNESDTLSMSPDVLCLRASTSVAVNEDEGIVSMLGITKRELRETFGADWGILYFFKPKQDFGAYQHCRMLALYKDGIGSVLVFFLFDDPNNDFIDLRFPAVRFTEMN